MLTNSDSTTVGKAASRRKFDDFHRRMQARSFPVLAEIIQKGQKAGLPPLRWELPISGAILGSGNNFDQDDAEATFRAWAKLLGLEVQRAERITTHVRWGAKQENYRGQHLVDLVLMCDLFESDAS